MTESAFLRACRGLGPDPARPDGHVPVWFMRQAGRSLPEYRALRGTGTILDAIAQPGLAAEITLQPVRRYGVDAAVLYSDIVVPVAAIGFGVDIEPGVGPVVARPFAGPADLDRLRPLEPEVDTPYVLETIGLLVPELESLGVPLIGFAGAPFTVASYLVEGRPSRTYARTKALMHADPALWHSLMSRLADLAVASLTSQIRAGASAVQLFDSWVGDLSRADYTEFVAPHTTRIFAEVDDLRARLGRHVPTIHFGVNTGELLDLLAATGPDVVGVDWRIPLDEAGRRVGPDKALQGNLDPALVLAPWPVLEAQARRVLTEGHRHPGGHIFNLGHGVTPELDPEVLGRLVDLVHAWSPEPTTEVPDGESADPASDWAYPRIWSPTVSPTGVIVMSYGTPASPDEVEAYYTDIRRGRPPTPDQLADLVGRYQAIGGVSPLAERTEAQRLAIADALDQRAPGRFTVVLGTKHATPSIEEAVAGLADQGVTRAVGLVLAPHFSRASVGEYQERAAEAGAARGLRLAAIDSWHLEPAYLDFLAAALAQARTEVDEPHQVLFTAHSLPERSLVDDPYPDQLRQSATAVAERLGLNRWAGWAVAWQSAGRTPEPWRGPDVLEVIAELGATGRSRGVVVCPQGFVSDHLEVLYDLDIAAAAAADQAGLAFARTRSLNDDPTVMAALADRVVATARTELGLDLPPGPDDPGGDDPGAGAH